MTDRPILDAISAEIGEALAAEDDGRGVPIVTCTVEYPLQPEHLADYASAFGQLPAQKSDEKDINVLRARHHTVARLLAAGIPEGLVAEFTNFSESWISTLKNSPSMQQLIAHYRAPGDNAAALIAEKLRDVGSQALARLESKMHELDPNTLIQLAKLGFDRSGHGPQSTQRTINENYHTDVAEVVRLASEARKRDRELLIPISEVRGALAGPGQQDLP